MPPMNSVLPLASVRRGAVLGALLAAALAAAFGGAARAAVVEDLHWAEVEVGDHSDWQLRQAQRDGLAQVLVKVSGRPAVLNVEDVRLALGQAADYLLQYQYKRRKEDGQLSLLLGYDEALVTQLLTTAGQPLWPANRPNVLLWLAVEDAAGRRFASRESHPALYQAVERKLRLRGVPAVFPLYDLQDAAALSVRELWRRDAAAAAGASRRYGLANVLVGRLTEDERAPGLWSGSWQCMLGDARFSQAFTGGELDEIISAGIDFLADLMAERYAVVAAAGLTAPEAVLVSVSRLERYADYRAALALLESIELVDAAWPVFAEGGRVVFSVQARVLPEQLDGIIAPSPHLERVSAPPASLRYRWLP